ncbi:glycosyltransferase, partial [Parasphingorhabdus sp.]|uniref:glycosyltransferase n=1 Tax=Parasphingorhabdus sp. TaxID=2709688 RepID=UPI003C71FBBA
YFWPEKWQQLAYPAILPNLKNRPITALLILPFLLAEFLATFRLARKEKLDLIYAHWVMPQGLIAYLMKLICGTSYVIQNHSSDLEIFSRLGPIGRAFARKIIRASDRLFCVNAQQRKFALNLFDASERIELEKKVLTLPMGVASDFAREDESSYDSEAPFQFDLGTISRLSRKKGLPFLIEAVSGLNRDGLEVSTGIAGDGEDRDALVAAAGSAEIEFTGFLQGTDKKKFFEQTKIFVFTSVAAGSDVEGLPVSLLEALCLGKMVIASRDTNIEMLPEWDLLKEQIYFLEDPSDIVAFEQTIRNALSLDREKLIARSQRIKAIMSRYRWDHLIREYLGATGTLKQEAA